MARAEPSGLKDRALMLVGYLKTAHSMYKWWHTLKEGRADPSNDGALWGA